MQGICFYGLPCYPVRVKKLFRIVLWAIPIIAAGILISAVQTGFWQDEEEQPELASWKPAEKDVREVARRLDEAFIAGDGNYFNTIVAPEVIFRRATAVPNVPKPYANAFMNEPWPRQNIVQDVIKTVGRRGSYRFLSIREVDGRYRALFRMLSEAGSVNYHELVFSGLYESGRPVVRVVDFFVYSTGELLSQSLRRDFLSYCTGLTPELIDSLEGTDYDYTKNIRKLDTMGMFLNEGHPDEALKMYDHLPPNLRRQTFVLLPMLLIAGFVDQEAIDENVALFKKYDDGNPAIDMTLLRLYQQRNDQPRLIQQLERMNEIIPGDAYPNAARGVLLYDAGKQEEGYELVYKAVEQDPMIWIAYPSLLSHMLQKKDHPRTAALLNEMRIRFGMDIGNIKEDPRFADFIKSPHFEG